MYMDKLFELIGVENHKYFTSNFAMKHNTLGHNDISYEDDSLTQEVGKVALQVCVTTGPGQAAGQVHYHKHWSVTLELSKLLLRYTLHYQILKIKSYCLVHSGCWVVDAASWRFYSKSTTHGLAKPVLVIMHLIHAFNLCI